MNKILALIAFFFGILCVFTSHAMYKLGRLMKATNRNLLPPTARGIMTDAVRVSKVYCTSCVVNDPLSVTFTIFNQGQDTSLFYKCLEKYNRIIVKKLILEVRHVGRTKESITFQARQIPSGINHFTPLMAYNSFESIKNVGNSILWVIHLSSTV